MSEQSTPEPKSPVETQANLTRLAHLLREADHLEPNTQKALAGLLEELGTELNSASLAPEKTTRLTEAVSEVARSLHEQHSTDAVATARDRLKEAATRDASTAPAVTSIVYRFIDLLASLGI